MTDEQIRALMEKNRYEPVNYGVTASIVHELCTRVLAAEARVKVLEDALRPFAAHAPVYDIDAHQMSGARFKCGELTAARKALEPSLSPQHKLG